MPRTLKHEIPEKVAKIEELRKTMSVLQACQTVGLSYRSYLDHRDEIIGPSFAISSNPRIESLFRQIVAEIRQQTRDEILQAISEPQSKLKPFQSKPLTGD